MACAVSWGTRLLVTGVLTRCVALRVRCPGPLGSCSPVCPFGVLRCVCGVLGHLAAVHRRARSVCCLACAVTWATSLLFTGVRAQCVVLLLCVRCPGPLGSCSAVCALRVLCCLLCAVSWATWFLFLSVPARYVVWRVRCPGPLASWSLMWPLRVLCRVCGVMGLLAPVRRCARSVCCVAFLVSCATGFCSAVCPSGALSCVCGVLGHFAPVHRCARSMRCVACAVSWATWLLFTRVTAPCVVSRVRCLRSLGSCPHLIRQERHRFLIALLHLMGPLVTKLQHLAVVDLATEIVEYHDRLPFVPIPPLVV